MEKRVPIAPTTRGGAVLVQAVSASRTFGSWEAAVEWFRSQPENAEIARDAYYDDPLATAAHRYWTSGEWEGIRKFLPPQRKRALDVGAGRGIASYALAKEGFEVTALEPDPSPIVGAAAIRALAASEHLAISTVETASEELPFPDGHFDLVFVRAVLHHTQDLEAACREIFRVLRPGGRFMAVREHVISRQSDLPAFLAAHPLHALYGGENAFLLDGYRSAMTAAGFRIAQTLSPLKSEINLFPQTRTSLKSEVCQRLAKVPGAAGLAERAFQVEPVFDAALSVLTFVDNRPGRLYSFVCDKPGGPS